MIKDVLLDIMDNYLEEKKSLLKNNSLANKIRKDYPQRFTTIVKEYGNRYIVKGSPGQGTWADCPWIAILDTFKTTSPQDGYYLVYLFEKDMKSVYLSLIQSVTLIRNEYGHKTKNILKIRAEEFRNKLNYLKEDNKNLLLNSFSSIPKLYEKASILAVHYDAQNMPNEQILKDDFERFLHYYQDLIILDIDDVVYENQTIEERKKRRLHELFDRRGAVSKEVKREKGYKCEVCDFQFSDKYGELGNAFIEAHHLLPFAKLKEGITSLNLEKDFVVLCSNCHRMIHRLEDPSNVEKLKEIVRKH